MHGSAPPGICAFPGVPDKEVVKEVKPGYVALSSYAIADHNSASSYFIKALGAESPPSLSQVLRDVADIFIGPLHALDMIHAAKGIARDLKVSMLSASLWIFGG